jgi:hypothetical protein
MAIKVTYVPTCCELDNGAEMLGTSGEPDGGEVGRISGYFGMMVSLSVGVTFLRKFLPPREPAAVMTQ